MLGVCEIMAGYPDGTTEHGEWSEGARWSVYQERLLELEDFHFFSLYSLSCIAKQTRLWMSSDYCHVVIPSIPTSKRLVWITISHHHYQYHGHPTPPVTRCFVEGDQSNWDRWVIVYARSGIVPVNKYIKEPIICWYAVASVYSSSSSMAFHWSFESIGVETDLQSCIGKWFRILSIYVVWERVNPSSVKVIWIPRSQLSSPMLLILNSVFNTLMVCSFSSPVAPTSGMASTYIAKDRSPDS